MTVKAKTGQKGPRQPQKQHFCPEHGKVCQAVKMRPGNRMRWHCPQGCVLTKRETVLR